MQINDWRSRLLRIKLSIGQHVPTIAIGTSGLFSGLLIALALLSLMRIGLDVFNISLFAVGFLQGAALIGNRFRRWAFRLASIEAALSALFLWVALVPMPGSLDKVLFPAFSILIDVWIWILCSLVLATISWLCGKASAFPSKELEGKK